MFPFPSTITNPQTIFNLKCRIISNHFTETFPEHMLQMKHSITYKLSDESQNS